MHSNGRTVVALHVVIIAGLLLFPLIGVEQYVLRVGVQMFLNAIVALGFITILGFSKQFSLGQVAIYGIGSYAMANFTAKLGLGFVPSICLSAIIGAVVGSLVAIPGARFRGPWLALVTFAFAEIVRILMMRFEGLTGGTAGFRDIPRPYILGWEVRTEFDYYFLFLAVALIVYFIVLRLRLSAFGRIWLALGDSPDIVGSVGVNVFAHRILAFAIGSAIAGSAGALFASYTTYVSPESFGFGHTVFYLTILVVGGLESIVGLLVSVVFFTVSHNYLTRFHPWDLVLDGLIIILFMNFLPQGVGSKLSNIFNKNKRGGQS